MPSIPLPFVVSLVLLLQLGVIVSRSWPERPRWPVVIFLAVAAAQAAIVGARWGLAWTPARMVQPVTAALLPPLALWVLDDIAPTGARRARNIRIVAAATVLLALAGLPLRLAIDFALIGLYASVGFVLLARGLAREETFGAARLDDMRRVRVAVAVLGLLFIGGAVVDTLVGLILAGTGNAAAIVAIGNVVTLAAAAVATVIIAAARVAAPGEPLLKAVPEIAAEPDGAEANAAQIGEEETALLDGLAELMRERQLYRDPDLSLERLARRLGVPARAVSAAINRYHHVNVSQFVNGYRIAEAQALLATTDRPVTAIQFDVGFLTKSNFQREFRRIVGMSPSDWRDRQRQEPAGARSVG